MWFYHQFLFLQMVVERHCLTENSKVTSINRDKKEIKIFTIIIYLLLSQFIYFVVILQFSLLSFSLFCNSHVFLLALAFFLIHFFLCSFFYYFLRFSFPISDRSVFLKHTDFSLDVFFLFLMQYVRRTLKLD